MTTRRNPAGTVAKDHVQRGQVLGPRLPLASMHGRAVLVLVLGAVLCMTGCSRQAKRQMKYGSINKAAPVALPEDLAHSNADERREAVAALAEGREVTRPEVFAILDAVARTDPVSQIRCVAIRGLGRYGDDRPVRTLLAVLQASKQGDKALPPDEDIRWESLRALINLDQRKAFTSPQRDLLRDACIRMAEFDPSRNVRIAATEMLGHFRDRAVLAPLIRLVRNTDFAIAERAELSLIALTGVTHDYDPDAWETWVANTKDPFEKAGQTPVTTRPTPPTWFQQQGRAFRRAIKLGGTD
jgi:HEAT repeat protein